MAKAIGMIEYKTVASGMTAADLMVKTAEVEVIEAKTVCPGKYLVLITGDLSSVKAAVDAASEKFPLNTFFQVAASGSDKTLIKRYTQADYRE
jgi:microcompartment protein CcmL/EutN